jgi:hypothetical protein
MRDSTTVRLSRGTRDNLRRLADHDGVTLDEEVAQLVRAERQRRIGQALSAVPINDDERAWLELGENTVHDHASG